MAITYSGDVAVIRNGGMTTILITPGPETVSGLRGLLANANAEGIGEAYPEVRQLLQDAETALQSAFRPTYAPG